MNECTCGWTVNKNCIYHGEFSIPMPGESMPTKPASKSLLKSVVAPADVEPKFEKILALVFKDAEQAKTNGHTQVAELVVTQARYFRYGLSREVPPEWKNYADELARLEDHEYQVYLRLKKKFEGT